MPRPPLRPLPEDAPELLHALAREDEAHPLARKLLVAPAAGAGRELLRTLARARGGWTGFEVTTVRPLAVQVAVEWIASEGVRVLDAFEEEARLDEALEAALADPTHGDAFGELAEGPGFRRAVREALKALRLTGIDADGVERGGFENRGKQFLLAAVLRHYEVGLARSRTTDVAGLLDRAARALDRGARLPADRVLLMPGLGLRGRAGRFVRALEARGAVRLTTDPVLGLEPPAGILWAPGPERSPLARLHANAAAPAAAPAAVPSEAPSPDPEPDPDPTADLPLFASAPARSATPAGDAPSSATGSGPMPSRATPSGATPSDATAFGATAPVDLHLFRAAGVHEELREVLRRVSAAGRRWDDVEIVTPDPGTYGPTLHTLCSRLGIDTTFAVGLPVARTRPGRAVAAWLRWIADDCPSPVLRRLLQTGDLVAPGSHPAGSPRLARTLRALRIGWGRRRYRPLVAAALERRRSWEPSADRHRTLDEAQAANAREIRDLQALDRLLRAILEAAPDPARNASPADVARGLAAFLELVPTESEVDHSAHERLLRTLDRIAHTLERPTRFSTALATVREHLEIRVPAPRAEGKAPWLSDGGALHLSDLEHGGLSGRPLLFVVGMDAGRFPGGDRQDPFLLDRERRSLHGDLPVTDDRIREQHFRFAALMARARGTITVSYPAWEAAEARVLQPSSVILTLHRLRQGDAALGYGDLEARLEAPASRVPRGRPAIDVEDLWMAALDDDGRLRDGRAPLRARFEALDRGLAAAEAPGDTAPSAWVGILDSDRPGRGARLDPRDPSGPRLSASSLESLGACPLRFFYSHVLKVRKPDDPEFDLERWLPAAERGSLLHDVFEAAVDRARAESLALDGPAFRAVAFEALTRGVARMRAELPPPSEAVFQAEVGLLEEDVRSFCAHLATEGPATGQVVATELALGGEDPVSLELPGGGAIRVRGRVDRVDRLDEGLRIVDYKTGSDWGHGEKEGTYRGGRRLQHVLYARAVEAQLPDEPPVARVEYHFPTRKGGNQVHGYEAARLADGMELVDALVDLAASGRFPATDDPSDCTWCDYRVVCRFGSAGDGDDSAPRVEWTRARIDEGHEAVAGLRRVRAHEEEG